MCFYLLRYKYCFSLAPVFVSFFVCLCLQTLGNTNLSIIIAVYENRYLW